MAHPVYLQIKSAFGRLNPRQLQEAAERPIGVGLLALSSDGYSAMEDFLIPADISRKRRYELVRVVHREGDPGAPSQLDIELCDGFAACPDGAFRFYRDDPERTVHEILDARSDLALPLARRFPPFRRPVIDRVISRIARENALFSLATALPVAPALLRLPWAAGEFASDTAFVTMNQVRMAFLIAAASDEPVGFAEQAGQIGAVVGGALAFRTLARELAAKMPFAGGLMPKAAVAYAGTFAAGLGLERFYRLGYGLSRDEREQVYAEAIEKGKIVIRAFLKAARLEDRALRIEA